MHSGRLKVLIPAGVERQFNVENNNEKEKKKNPNKQIGESFNMVLDETGCK
jgi:hypothetical protein